MTSHELSFLLTIGLCIATAQAIRYALIARRMRKWAEQSERWLRTARMERDIAREQLANWRELAMPDEPSDEAIERLNATQSDYEAASSELDRWRPSQTDLHGECCDLVNELHEMQAEVERMQQLLGDA